VQNSTQSDKSHLVSEREQRRRDFEAERFCGFEIDHELEFGRLHDRQVARPDHPISGHTRR
jgi:hypothetical protein